MQIALQPSITQRMNKDKHFPSYRCRTRPYHQACEMDPALDGYIQLKARNSTDALTKARLVAHRDMIVIDVERLDG